MDLIPHPIRDAASVGGRALQGTIGVMSALRPASKPLHPDGSVTRAVVRRFGGGEPSGAAWLDEPGEEDVVVRISRAVGLPDPVPDIFGLALRTPVPGGRHGDLLLASTGRGRLTRFTLTVSRSPWGRPLTSLLPYRSPSGPVLISAVRHAERSVALSWARPSGAWIRFAELTLRPDATARGDEPISFDPIANPVPGLDTYDWVERLRQPSYRTARRTRGEPG
jgi:hypothetical protein